MKLYLISQNENGGYDTYDSMVVCAESEDDARQLHPAGEGSWGDCFPSWASSPDNVNIEYLGEASNHLKADVICSSFNAG